MSTPATPGSLCIFPLELNFHDSLFTTNPNDLPELRDGLVESARYLNEYARVTSKVITRVELEGDTKVVQVENPVTGLTTDDVSIWEWDDLDLDIPTGLGLAPQLGGLVGFDVFSEKWNVLDARALVSHMKQTVGQREINSMLDRILPWMRRLCEQAEALLEEAAVA